MDLIPPSWSSYPTNTTPSDGNLTSKDILTGMSGLIYGKEELFQGYSSNLLTFASAMCIVFILTGIPGNLITIIALARCKKVRNATVVFIINLSFSDLLFCCFNLPLATSTFWHRAWVHGEILCRFSPFMRYGLLAVSLFTVLAITINRYVMIGHPRVYQRIYQNRYLCIMVIAIWFCAFGSLIPTWRGMWGTFGLDKSIGSCTILTDRNGNSPKEFLFIVAFLVPCFSIIICYARIFCIVRKTAMRSHEPVLVIPSLHTMSVAHVKAQSQPLEEDNGPSRTVLYLAPEIILPEMMQQEPELVPEIKPLTTGNKPYFPSPIDTSIDSELPRSSREELTVKSTDTASFHTYSLAKASRNLNGSRAVQNNRNQLTVNEVDYIAEDATSSSDNNHTSQTTSSNDNGNQLHSMQIEPSSSSGIDIPIDNHASQLRQQRSIKSLSNSLRSSRKRRYLKKPTKNTSGGSILYPGRMTKKDRRLLKMILVIFISFLICYLPITITKIAKKVTEIHVLNIMGYLLIYLTTCINPIIYVVMSNEYRQAYWNLLMCRTTSSSTTTTAPNAQRQTRKLESNISDRKI